MDLGFALANITPADGLVLAGTRPWRRAHGVLSPLCGRVLLADDGTHRVAVVCLDLMALPADGVAELRTRLAAAGGLDPDAILVACSHTHSAPMTYLANAPDEDAVARYRNDVYGALASAMTRAVADLQPATLAVGRVLAPGWAFNRRPIYANGEVGSHGPAAGYGFHGMEDVADEDLAVLLVRGRDGAIRGGLVTFACHPTCMELAVPYSADYAGELMTALERRYGGTFGFLLGAAGDTAPNDPTQILTDPEHGVGAAHARAMGQALAERAAAAISAARTVSAARVTARSTRLQIAQRTPTPQQVELARWYLEDAPDDLDERAFTRQLYGHAYTFGGADAFAPGANEYYVRELLGMWEWRRRAGVTELIDEVEIQVVLLGDVALVAFPVELFTAFGRRLKAASPFGATLIATLANGWYGYTPTPEAFARGGFEPRFAYKSRQVPEAGDRMTDAALNLLQQLGTAGPTAGSAGGDRRAERHRTAAGGANGKGGTMDG